MGESCIDGTVLGLPGECSIEGLTHKVGGCHRLPQKWTDSVVVTTLSAYISHGQEPGYSCSTDLHTVKGIIVL
jgi:hypothetical protein